MKSTRKLAGAFRQKQQQEEQNLALERLVGERTAELIVAKEDLEKRVHELATAKNQLVQAEKLQAVGQLAAGIAHEINTPIQFISDNLRFIADAFADISGLLRAETTATVQGACGAEPAGGAGLGVDIDRADDVDLKYLLDEVPTAIAQTTEGVERVATIVRAMKAFGHPGGDTMAANDLNQAVRDTVVVATSEIRHVADVRLELDEALPPVWCDIASINQVVLNLVVNASHAMKAQAEAGHRGTLTIRSRTDGDDVVLQVTDTGTGIPPEVAHRIFDQFFTTKPVGQGTGQGLALAHTVIHDHHGGTITFESISGAGTTFTVRLPNRER
jgi:signal transduction histidine kinase